MFQSRSGFSPCFDRRGIVYESRNNEVSIPVWVFSLLRPDRAKTTGGTTRTGFNPGLGFLPASTTPGVLGQHSNAVFQSRSGFSPCFDGAAAVGGLYLLSGFNPGLGFLPASTVPSSTKKGRRGCFNPGLGFLPASTSSSRSASSLGIFVSIPVWVFSLLRQNPTAVTSPRLWRFNPGLGFLPASTVCSH